MCGCAPRSRTSSTDFGAARRSALIGVDQAPQRPLGGTLGAALLAHQFKHDMRGVAAQAFQHPGEKHHGRSPSGTFTSGHSASSVPPRSGTGGAHGCAAVNSGAPCANHHSPAGRRHLHALPGVVCAGPASSRLGLGDAGEHLTRASPSNWACPRSVAAPPSATFGRRPVVLGVVGGSGSR